MGKFNNQKAFSVIAEPPRTTLEWAAPIATSSAPVVSGNTAPEAVGSLQRAGFVMLCAYNLSVFANDLSLRFLHHTTYISLVTELLLPIVLLFSGAAFRGLRLRAGKFWLVFFLCMVIDLPFSVWPGGTAQLLIDYGIKSWPLLFYVSSFVVTLPTLRRFMYFQVVASVLLLVSCYTFGQQTTDARFQVTGSMFFANANELAMQILFGVTALLFVFLRGSMVGRVLASAAIAASMLYVFRTASRGALIGSLALFIAITLMSRRKIPILAFAVLVAVLASFLLSAQTMNRLKLAFTSGSVYEAQSEDEVSAIASRLQRKQLLQRSLWLAITHPLFGIGPGQFAVEESGDLAKQGKWAPWLGTHNSYTQVASECGLPAFFCYMAVLIFAFRTNYRIFRATRGTTVHADMHAMSVCMLASLVIYAVCTFFDHIGYSGLLAMLAGFSISLTLLAQQSGILPPSTLNRV